MSGWGPDQYDQRQQRPTEQPGYRPPPWPPQGYQSPPQQQWQQPQYRPGPPPRKPPNARKIARWIVGAGFALVLLIIVIAASHAGSDSPPAAGPSASQPAVAPASTAVQAAAKQTVTYVVTGSAADVTYGPAGSDYSGTVPMRVTKAIPSSAPIYYAISAQLQGSGTVTCKIEVSGKIVSQATAGGGYNIAQCEISQNPLSGAWTDTNA